MSISAPISQRTVKSAQDPSGRFYWADTLARRREGATQLQLRVQLGTRWRRLLDAALPAGFGGLNRAEIIAMPPIVSSGATPVDYYFRDHFEKPLLVLLAISILVLIVSCVNVANLLLARGLQRQREIAIRVAMGAARWRLLRQLVAESGVLLSVALLSAFVLAFVSTRVLIDFFIRAFDRPDLSFTVGLDARLLMFTGLAAVLAVMIFAALPAWRSSDIDPAIPLRSESRSTTGPHARARRTLLCGQLAMTLVIVICANAFAESGRYLQDTAVNFNGDSVINIQLMPTARSESTGRTSESYFFNLIDRVSSLPGVARASLASFAPLVSVPFREDVRRLDEPEKKGLRAPAEFVTDGFLDVMHIPLLQGRDFRRVEARLPQRTAIVSQSAAQSLFPEGNAIGRHIQFGTEPETRDLQIVGIASDDALEDPHMRDRDFILLNLWQLQRMANWANLQVRFSGPAPGIITGLRNEVERAGVQEIFMLNTISQLRERALLQDRLLTAIAKPYVALVLILSAFGVGGLLLFFVSRREKEIAIRIALGAEPHEIAWLSRKKPCC